MVSLKLDHLTMLRDIDLKEKMCTRGTAQDYPGNKQNFLNYFAQKFFLSVVGCFEGKTKLCKYGCCHVLDCLTDRYLSQWWIPL